MKKLVQFFISVQKLDLFDIDQKRDTRVIYIKLFGIVVKSVEVQPVKK